MSWMRRLAGLRMCLQVIRPHIVAGGFLGYCLGVLLAILMGGKIYFEIFVLGYLIVLFGDLATHFSNDYYDVDIDKNAPTKTFGGSNFLVEHPEIRPLAIGSAIFLSAGSLFIALLMVSMFGFPPLLLHLVAITNLFGWLYSTPPVSLNARGLGEVTIALGTGFSIPAVGYVATLGHIDSAFLIFSVPLILYGLILSLSLELPDLEVDREYGKLNLVVLIGRRKVTFLILLTSILASAFFVFFATFDFDKFWILPILSLFPIFASLKGYMSCSHSQSKANHTSMMNISSLFLFLATLNCFFLLKLI
ncbi:MAG: prenyltransferase [Candidatus Bathyarchaeota archaeon]|nr:MAG: prenyltransferase [Candidatus Bathyarchaeota archaeon]